jgi:hypothetical protein
MMPGMMGPGMLSALGPLLRRGAEGEGEGEVPAIKVELAEMPKFAFEPLKIVINDEHSREIAAVEAKLAVTGERNPATP